MRGPAEAGDERARAWFDRADQFHFTALYLMTQELGLQGVFAKPHIVMKAFATEAYLKSLICLEGRTPPQIHDLLALYELVSLDSQRPIQKRWNKDSKPKLDGLRKQKPPGYHPPRSLRGALHQSSDAFLDWRYKGEDAVGMGFSIMAFPTFVRERIVQLRPAWTHKHPHPLAWLNG